VLPRPDRVVGQPARDRRRRRLTAARSITSRCSSARENRDSATPASRGSSHAIALTWATCCGGKTTRATRPRSILKASQPLAREATSPAPDHLRIAIQPLGDLRIAESLGRVEHQLGPLDDPVRQRLARGPTRKLAALLGTQDDLDETASHHLNLRREPHDSS
jgi:hypothetical protein